MSRPTVRVAPPAATGAGPGRRSGHRRRWLSLGLLAVWGPGLVVMLADTDAGSLLTAAQSGARWGYAMILPQVVLMPILYLAQEITVRLGVCTGQGHGALIRRRFGPGWAFLSSGTLLLSAVGALLTEFAGVAGVGEVFGISKWVTVPAATVALVGVAFLRSYRRVERIGVLIGLAELAFLPAVVLTHPHLGHVLSGAASLPLGSPSYLTLLAANVGAVIMPWMVFYQQAAVIGKGLTPADLPAERRDTAVGSVVTQLIMLAVVVAVATASAHAGRTGSFDRVGQIVSVLAPSLGSGTAEALVGVAVLGAALVAALVVSLAGAWGMAEVLGWDHSLDERPGRSNARFFGTYVAAHVIGAAVVLASVNLVGLAVDVEVMNALLLPIVLGFLLLLEARALPPEHRMRGVHRVVATGACLGVMAFGLYLVPSTLGL